MIIWHLLVCLTHHLPIKLLIDSNSVNIHSKVCCFNSYVEVCCIHCLVSKYVVMVISLSFHQNTSQFRVLIIKNRELSLSYNYSIHIPGYNLHYKHMYTYTQFHESMPKNNNTFFSLTFTPWKVQFTEIKLHNTHLRKLKIAPI